MTEKPSFTVEQGSAALAKHSLGELTDWEPVQANMINAVYRAHSSEGCFYLKIQFRPGFSLKSQADATSLVQKATDLPVSSTCLFDGSADPFGHAYLICDALPGRPGRSLFEEADETLQREILQQYATVVAKLHQIEITSSTLPKRNLRDWKNRLREDLLNESDLIQALPPDSRSRISVLADLLETAIADLPPVPQGFLWGDAVLHNLLMDSKGQVTGVIDFENAGWGDLLSDQLFIESEFHGRKPREIYGRPDFRDLFWSSYEQAGGTRPDPDETYVTVRRAMQAAGLSWFWKAAAVLPPRTTQLIESAEEALRNLQPDGPR